MQDAKAAQGQVTAEPAPSRSHAAVVFRRLMRQPLGVAGLAVCLLLVLAAIFAPWIAPYPPAEMDLMAPLSRPDASHLLGTDQLGRDILSRIIYGARVSLQVMVVSMGLATVVGSAIGLLAGYLGGWWDEVAMRVMDALIAFPTLILALAVVAILGPNLTNAMLAIAIVNIPYFARLVRGETLVLRQTEFIDAARTVGAGMGRIVRAHIWPNLSGSVIVFASLRASQAIITESSLSFLGLGAQPPTPSWGAMVAVGVDYWAHAWWLSVFPGLAIFLTVMALNLVGDALRDAFDIKIRE